MVLLIPDDSLLHFNKFYQSKRHFSFRISAANWRCIYTWWSLFTYRQFPIMLYCVCSAFKKTSLPCHRRRRRCWTARRGSSGSRTLRSKPSVDCKRPSWPNFLLELENVFCHRCLRASSSGTTHGKTLLERVKCWDEYHKKSHLRKQTWS